MKLNTVKFLILSCFTAIFTVSSGHRSTNLRSQGSDFLPLSSTYRNTPRQGSKNPSLLFPGSATPILPLGPSHPNAHQRGPTFPNPYPSDLNQPDTLNSELLDDAVLQQRRSLITARAYVAKSGFGELIGFVDFIENRNFTFNVDVNIVFGLTPGLHGFHVHQFGDLSDGCVAAGPHYNPFNTNHGGPPNNPNRRPRHVGDFGNLVVSNNGSVFTRYQNVNFPLSLFLGRSVIIHARRDDLGIGNSPLSRTTGDSGGRVACGVIALTSES